MLTRGFRLVARPLGVEGYLYAEQPGQADGLLAVAQEGPQTMLLVGRLHYRDEPLARVRGRVETRLWAQCQGNDAALALAVYQLGGLEGLCGLEGDVALAGYDGTARQLVALRDPLGAYPLFWLQHGETLAVSTSIRPLIELLPVVELDSEYAAEYRPFPPAWWRSCLSCGRRTEGCSGCGRGGAGRLR